MNVSRTVTRSTDTHVPMITGAMRSVRNPGSIPDTQHRDPPVSHAASMRSRSAAGVVAGWMSGYTEVDATSTPASRQATMSSVAASGRVSPVAA